MRSVGPYSIRPMEPADVPTVVAIDRASFTCPWSSSAYLYELKRNTRSFYYVLLKPEATVDTPTKQGIGVWLRSLVGDQVPSWVIGYVGIRKVDTESQAHVTTLAIHPDWRGNGLGELMLMTVLEKALSLDVDRVTLEVRPSNHIAQRLYRKYGFRLKSRHRGYYRDGEDALFMAVAVGGQAFRGRLEELAASLRARIGEQVGQKKSNAL